MFTHMAADGEPWDIGYTNWFMDFPDSAGFLAPMFEGLFGHFYDAALFRRKRAATRLDDAARTRAFEQLDEDFARAGAAAPFATGATTDFFSDRIGCQVHQPIYGISLAALCVRAS